MVTHQIPRHCLATVQYRKQRLVLGLGRVDREGWLTSRYPLLQRQFCIYCQACSKRTFLYFFLLGKGADAGPSDNGIDCQLLCSLCVVVSVWYNGAVELLSMSY